MKRTFNYTGKKRLNRSDISITLSEYNGIKHFDASINLKEFDLPKDAKIYVEPYYKYSYMRFDYGTVENRETPFKRSLKDIPNCENIKFRVKIVDESTKKGKILAQASGLKPKNDDGDDENRESILPINFTDLDQEIWRVSFEDTQPMLEINNYIHDHKELIKNNKVIQSLVLPAALRVVLTNIISDEEEYDGKGDLWQDRWVRFLKESLFIDNLPNQNSSDFEKREWINNTVSSYCRKFHFLDNFLNNYGGA